MNHDDQTITLLVEDKIHSLYEIKNRSGIVLDAFAGTGTTGQAAHNLSRQFLPMGG